MIICFFNSLFGGKPLSFRASIKDFETLLTHLMDLPDNRVKGHVPKDADINRIRRQILAEHSREIREIKKVLKKRIL